MKTYQDFRICPFAPWPACHESENPSALRKREDGFFSSLTGKCKSPTYILVGIFIIVSSSSIVFAQAVKATSPSKIIEDMRNETATLLQDSDRLTQENDSLQKQYLNFQTKEDPGHLLENKKKSLNNEIFILKEKNKTFKKKLLTLEEKQRLRRLQADDLELEQRQLMLDYKL